MDGPGPAQHLADVGVGGERQVLHPDGLADGLEIEVGQPTRRLAGQRGLLELCDLGQLSVAQHQDRDWKL